MPYQVYVAPRESHFKSAACVVAAIDRGATRSAPLQPAAHLRGRALRVFERLALHRSPACLVDKDEAAASVEQIVGNLKP
jgi:hypothetical protein